jgi:hypothetical protein
LRKDPRSHYLKEAGAALLGHADTDAVSDKVKSERSAQALAMPIELRKRVLSMIRSEEQTVVERFSGNGHQALSPDAQVVVSPEARLSLEAIDDLVTLVVQAPSGERRAIAWDNEKQIVAAFAEATQLGSVVERTGLAHEHVASFCEELIAAGVFVHAST